MPEIVPGESVRAKLRVGRKARRKLSFIRTVLSGHQRYTVVRATPARMATASMEKF